MLGFNVLRRRHATKKRELLATSVQQAFVNLRTGNPGKLPPPLAGYDDTLPLQSRAMLEQVLGCSAIGCPRPSATACDAFIERTGADELMVTAQIYDHAARLRSYELLTEAVAA